MGSALKFDWTDPETGEQNDEIVRITLDDQPVITATHDAHAWDGMVGIIEALKALATLQGWRVEIVGEEGV